jgi:hypothetical protein
MKVKYLVLSILISGSFPVDAISESVVREGLIRRCATVIDVGGCVYTTGFAIFLHKYKDVIVGDDTTIAVATLTSTSLLYTLYELFNATKLIRNRDYSNTMKNHLKKGAIGMAIALASSLTLINLVFYSDSENSIKK